MATQAAELALALADNRLSRKSLMSLVRRWYVVIQCHSVAGGKSSCNQRLTAVKAIQRQ